MGSFIGINYEFFTAKEYNVLNNSENVNSARWDWIYNDTARGRTSFIIFGVYVSLSMCLYASFYWLYVFYRYNG